ncbi:MAG: hypothetical protein IT422_15020 [Pirellulaceae bacterium]|nr:hypothetical protein [Pirellulaceae bacterium]
MSRLSNRSIAEQTAMSIGVAITLISLLPIIPKPIFAAGFSTVFLGVAFSSFSSRREIPKEKRLPYIVVGTIIETALIAMVCYIVWDCTNSFPLFIAVLAGSSAIYFLVYWLMQGCLNKRRQECQKATEQ